MHYVDAEKNVKHIMFTHNIQRLLAFYKCNKFLHFIGFAISYYSLLNLIKIIRVITLSSFI